MQPCGPATEPKNPGMPKYEKNTKSPHPGKIRKKYRKNTKTGQKLPFWARFCIFSVFFSDFRGPTLGGGFCIFSYFRHSGVFGLCSRPARRVARVGDFFLFRSPFGNRFITFFDAFGHFLAYPLLPPPFCGRVITLCFPFVLQSRNPKSLKQVQSRVPGHAEKLGIK